MVMDGRSDNMIMIKTYKNTLEEERMKLKVNSRQC